MDDDTLDAVPEPLDATLAASPRAASEASVRVGRGALIGRYTVLYELGAGGMGVVYAAYDPELDRKVALKFLRDEQRDSGASSQGRARLLREAQALARFSHPEIVTIYDVGSHDAGVWMAMELVDGVTLGRWVEQSRPSWPDLVEVMLAVGRGLAAAHAAGLVHRDLKPDNVMIDKQGRVRVMDFGLTRAGEPGSNDALALDETLARPNQHLFDSPLTQHGALLGTPAYMAPEQFAGKEVTAAADQFAFCVSFWELLYGQRPFAGDNVFELAAAVIAGKRRPPPSAPRIPRWLRQAIERGMRNEPADRWPSMDALLSELGRGRARRRRRAWAAAALACGLAGAGAWGWQRWEEAAMVASCERDSASIDRIWNDEVRARMRAEIVAVAGDSGPASVDRILPALDAWVTSWRSERAQACRAATIDAELTPELWRAAQWCFDERAIELEVLLDRMSTPDHYEVTRAIALVGGLTPVTRCVDLASLERVPVPPDAVRADIRAAFAKLGRGASLQARGRFDEAVELAVQVRATADALDWAPLRAAAMQRHGTALERVGDYALARSTSEDAYLLAAESGAWTVAADAATVLSWITGVDLGRADEGRTWSRLAKLALAEAGVGDGFRDANLLHDLAVVEYSAGNLEQAVELMNEARLVIERRFGPNHPRSLQLQLTWLLLRYEAGARREIRADVERVSNGIAEAMGAAHPLLVDASMLLARIEIVGGELDSALEHATTARELAVSNNLGRDHPDLAGTMLVLGEVQHQRGQLAEADEAYVEAAAMFERLHGANHSTTAGALASAGANALALGHTDDAVDRLERALAAWRVGEQRTEASFLASYRLAQALRAQGGDADRIRREAEVAIEGLRSLGRSALADEAEAWLAASAAESSD